MSLNECFYCPHCGYTTFYHENECGFCGWPNLFEINPKWNINYAKWEEMRKPYEYGEITYKQFEEQWEEYCKGFFDEVITKRPEFDKKVYWKYSKWHYDNIEAFIRRQKKEEEEAKNPSSKQDIHTYTSLIQCPYCNSYQTKKISGLSRAFSAGLFGLGSKKIGKQWHCTNCGSDF